MVNALLNEGELACKKGAVDQSSLEWVLAVHVLKRLHTGCLVE